MKFEDDHYASLTAQDVTALQRFLGYASTVGESCFSHLSDHEIRNNKWIAGFYRAYKAAEAALGTESMNTNLDRVFNEANSYPSSDIRSGSGAPSDSGKEVRSG